MTKTSTNYIFLKSSNHSDLLVRNIIGVLAGGFIEEYKRVCFVMLGEISSEINNYIEHYNNSRKKLSPFDSDLFRIEIMTPIVLDVKEDKEETNKLLLGANTRSAQLVWKRYSQISKFDFDMLRSGDIVTIVSSTEFPSTLAMNSYVKALIPSENNNISLRHICEYEYTIDKEKRELNKTLIDCFVDVSDSIVVGDRTDQYKSGMTIMQTAVAILDQKSVNKGCIPETNNNKNILYYTPLDLNSPSVANSLYKMDILLQLCNMVKEQNSDIKKWIRNNDITCNSIDDVLSKDINAIISMYKSTIDSIPIDHFRISHTNPYLDNFIKNINTTSVQINGLTVEEKRKLWLKEVVEAIKGVNKEISFRKAPQKKYNRSQTISPHIFDNSLSEIPSPSFWWEQTNLSFCYKAEGLKEAKMLRSYCLDLWELFFEVQKTRVCDVLNISECVFSSENYNMLAIKNNRIGKRLFEDRIMYIVSSVRNKEQIAYSSPLTGFATIPNNEYDICINNRHYLHQDHILDLNERSPYFQAFIYNYSRCIGGFSEEFIDYIQRQLTDNDKHDEDSKGRNIFKLYPRFRQHIGIEII